MALCLNVPDPERPQLPRLNSNLSELSGTLRISAASLKIPIRSEAACGLPSV